jgi:hypothetical protein
MNITTQDLNQVLNNFINVNAQFNHRDEIAAIKELLIFADSSVTFWGTRKISIPLPQHFTRVWA